MEDRARFLGEIAWDVLSRIVREVLDRKAGGYLVEGSLRDIEIRVPLALSGPSAGPSVFSEKLRAAVEEVVDDAIQQAVSFRPGHAFCHRCRGAVCEHSEPPSGRHVFLGYGPTGAPKWVEFAQLCLDVRHPHVDQLYGDPPAFVTLVHGAEPLNIRLVGALHAPGYELLGQVVAGFFAVPPLEGEGRGVLALTMQAAAARSRAGRLRLGMNLLGRAPSGGPLELVWDRSEDVPWRQSVRWAQAALESVARSSNARRVRDSDGGVPSGVRRRVEGILQGLARRLEREHRSRIRRTQHAETRHRSGERPTRKAQDDLRLARPETILVDEKNGTLVVAGERGRTHFFTADGRLVSSVRYSRDAVERKLKLGLWRAATPPEAEVLLGHAAPRRGSADE